MLYIVSCKTYSVVATAKTDAEAVRLCKENEHDGWACFIEDTSQGAARIVGDSDGIDRKPAEMLPYWARCGNVMTGREYE